MRLSIFEADDTLSGPPLNIGGAAVGQVQGGIGGSAVGRVQTGRQVLIEIKGAVARALFAFYKEEDWIQDVLKARGWDIRRVDKITSGILPSADRTWHVTAFVHAQYGDGDIVTNARNHLMAQGMSVSSVRIVRGTAAAYVDYDVSASGGDGTGASAVSTILPNLALGLGISTPVILLAGGVLLVIVLRK